MEAQEGVSREGRGVVDMAVEDELLKAADGHALDAYVVFLDRGCGGALLEIGGEVDVKALGAEAVGPRSARG